MPNSKKRSSRASSGSHRSKHTSPVHTYDVEVRWENYRSFVDTGWIKLKPLTILVGTNSSGKSSFISPLLILAQTIRSADRESAIITRGDMADVGDYRDLIHNHET